MQKYLLSLIIVLLGSSLFAQDKAQKNIIIKETNVNSLLVQAEIYRQESIESKAKAIAKAKINGWSVLLKTETQLMELQELDANGNPLYYITNNEDAAISVSTNELYTGGSLGLNLDGTGMTAGEWDGGAVLSTHQEFNNTGSSRINQGDSPTGTSAHATHVAGTILAGGVVSQAKGMAFNANLSAYDWNNDETEMATEAAGGLLISNHSYGYATGWYWDGSAWQWGGDEAISNQEDWSFGFYSAATQAWDFIAYNAPYYLIVKSAGNDRGDGPSNGAYPQDGPYDCLPTKGNAKNILTVGAVQDVAGGYTGDPNAVTMSSFSSWGPSDDGRIKPDICGNGVGLYSSLNGSNSDYTTYSGTSMSAPNVTGSLLLLQQHYFNLNGTFMRASTLKALAIHTADECGPDDGPDYMFGWGLLNTESAAHLITERNATALINEENYTGSEYTIDVTATGTEPLIITMVWTDPAGTPPAAGLDPADIMLVNDLDLTVTKDANSYYPYLLDKNNPSAAATTGNNDVDNVEKVYISNPVAGEYTIHITHEGTIESGSQNYSLIVQGITSGAIVVTNDPSNISDNSVDASGEVVSDNGQAVTERGFVYSTTPSPNTNDDKVIVGSGVGVFNTNITGLSSSTTYYLKAYAINANGTSYGQEKSFVTSCGSAASLPFAEDFEDADFPPACWDSYRGANGLGTTYDWMSVTFPQQGSKAAFVRYEDVTGGIAQDWLVSPLINLNANSTMSFYQKQSYDLDFGSSYSVRISTTSQTDRDSFITQEFWSETDFGIDYTEQTINLAAYTGQDVYIAFVLENDNGDDWFIDNINITNNVVTPTATISATAGCSTGTITVSSSLSGIQTFYLTEEDGTVITSSTLDATSYNFTDLADATYRGKVEKDGQMSGLTDAVSLVNNDVPTQPSSITGNTSTCENASETYSVSNVSGLTYNWTLPNGWTGSSTTNSITVSVGSNSGSISVTAENDCGLSTSSNLSVSVSNVPNQPSVISGNTNVCENTAETYSVTNVAGLTYVWTLPNGWTGSSSTHTISVGVGSGSGSISVMAENDCGLSTSRSLSVTVSNVPDQPSVISGDLNPCEGSSQTYSVTNDAETYTWDLPDTWTGSSTTNSINVVVGEYEGYISVIPSNSCGEGVERHVIAVPSFIPSQPNAISGNTQLCEGTSEVYSVVNNGDVDSYSWTLPSGWTGSSTSNSITVVVGSNDGNITVAPTNECGTGTAQSLAVQVSNSGPSQPGNIIGDLFPCSGTSETYSVPEDPAVEDYSWTLPSGWTGSSTTNSITVIVGSNGGEISVIPSNLCGTGPAQTASLSVTSSTPSQPDPISGNDMVCSGNTETYSVNLVSDVEYTWLLPSGWTGSSTSNVISVVPEGSSGEITVFASNGCGASPSQSLFVDVNSIPFQPDEIIGEVMVCQGSSQTYSVTEEAGLNYTWTIPSDWTGSSTSHSITVTVGSEDGNISVTANNTCGNSPAEVLAVQSLNILGAPGTISGETEVCTGDESVAYSIIEMEDAETYHWTLPNNVEIVSGLGTAQIEVDFFNDAESGNISVQVENICGLSSSSVLEVEVNEIPSEPNSIIGVNEVMETQSETYQIDDISGAESYAWILEPSWILNSGAGTTEVNITFPMGASSGNLSVAAQNACGISDYTIMHIEILPIGLEGTELLQNLVIYPNPSTGIVFIDLSDLTKEDTHIKVLTLTGSVVFEEIFKAGSKKLNLNLTQLAPGTYMIDLENGIAKQQYKIVIID